MIRKILFISLMVFVISVVNAGEKAKTWREDFEVGDRKGDLPAGWEVRGTIWGTNETSFELENKKDNKAPVDSVLGVLKVFADKATGALFCAAYKYVDLNKTPIMRWRWHVNKFPKGGDGRKSDCDDQAIAIYIGANDWMIKKSISYRWETETPQGLEGNSCYGGGAVKVKWFCLRNKKTGTGKWVTEERNIAMDFKKAYGFIPKKFVLSIGANSQNTHSKSLAFLDYIEFLPLDKEKDMKVAMKSDKKNPETL
jgi:hypothetical protein